MFPGIFFKKRFALIDAQKVPRAILMGMSVLHSIAFSPAKHRKARDKGKAVSFLTKCGPGVLVGGPGSSHAVHLDPGCSLWATLTLVSQGYTLKNPGSMRWSEGQH